MSWKVPEFPFLAIDLNLFVRATPRWLIALRLPATILRHYDKP